jgi:hypothetical protein
METLDKHFRILTKAAFAKHGFASADLLSHWPDIIGAENAALCVPERITWPRPKPDATPPAGTLTVKAAAGRALDVQYKAAQLLERINAYLGYRAIAKIKVQPGSLLPPVNATPALPHADPPSGLERIEDGHLKDALIRLSTGILTDKTRSPQGT